MNSKLLFINTTHLPWVRFRLHLNSFKCLCLLLLVMTGFTQGSICQNIYNGLSFGPVLINSDHVSGNFGEFRGNHFHSGIDYKTDETEGKMVFAAADGYVSRVKVSISGYGRAVYITHPNQVVTVYGHMRIFYQALEDTLRKMQLEKQDYEVEFFPDSSYFPVKEGTLIGYSGNTGSSEGPHLHFETRHAASEKPFNPEIAGYHIRDTVAPEIKALVIYHPGPDSGLAGSAKQILQIPAGYNASLTDTVMVGNYFFTGFESTDQAGLNESTIGFRSYCLEMDDSAVFYCQIDSFSFDETRMINSLIDYPYKVDSGKTVTLCYALKGNKLSFLQNQNGSITIKDTLVHALKWKVEDTAGNISEAGCFVKKNLVLQQTQTNLTGKKFKQGEPGKLLLKQFKIVTSKNSFYEDVRLKYSVVKLKKRNKSLLTPVYRMEPSATAIHDPVEISVKAPLNKSLPANRLIAVLVDSTGRIRSFPTTNTKGWLTFKTRSLGMFSVVCDTIPPKIVNNFWEPDIYSHKSKLVVELREEISGINKVVCSINGTWTISVFNARTSQLIIYPEDLPSGSEPLNFQVQVTDGAGNTAIQTLLIDYPEGEK